MQRIAWRTDSCAECKGPSGEDLSGGYYEAGGSYLKFSFPTAFTLTQLAWGVVQYREGYAKVRCPITSGGMHWLPYHQHHTISLYPARTLSVWHCYIRCDSSLQ